MIRKKPVLLLFLFGILLFHQLILSDYAGARPQYLIKFATVAPEGSTWIKQLRKLDKEVRAKSDGKLGFLIYAGGIAGDELDVLRKIRIGQIHCAAFTGVGFGQILPMVRVLDLPFLFHNNDEIDLVHRELTPFFSKEFQKRGFELLAWAEIGNVYLFSKKPIKKVEDLRGLKVWAWSGDPIVKETFAAMGVNPILLAITDVTTALNTGMINTVYAPPLGAMALQWYTSVSYMMSLSLAHSTGAILISSKYYNKLPQKLAKILTSSFDKGMKELTSILREQNKEAFQLIRDSGLTIGALPSGSNLDEFYNVHEQVARKLTDKVYPKEILEKVYNALKRPH